MRPLQFSEFGSASNLSVIELPDPQADPATAIVKIAAGAISPSDEKNVEGKMEHTTCPACPGATLLARSSTTRPNGLARRCGGFWEGNMNWP